jgi:hypothetical protein
MNRPLRSLVTMGLLTLSSAVAACAEGVSDEAPCSDDCEGDASPADATTADSGSSTPDEDPDSTTAEAAPATRTPDSSLLADGPSSQDATPTEGAPPEDSGSPRDASGDEVRDAPSDREAQRDAREESSVEASPDGGCGTVYLREPFTDDSNGWTIDTTWAIEATCASPPAPEKGYPDPALDHTTGGSSGVLAAYACGNNPEGKSAAAVYATSPVLDTSAARSLELTFYRWLNSDESKYMTSTVDVYDGTNWVNLYTNASDSLTTDSSWRREEYDVTRYAGPTFQVRFGYAVVSDSVYAMSCWNVDDLTVASTCQ